MGNNSTQLSLLEAKRLSIIKWEAHVAAGGCCDSLPKEVLLLKGYCGFCERWRRNSTEFEITGCQPCELAQITGGCFSETSTYDYWCETSKLEYAQKMLDAIKSIETK